tara:strand:+ start:991 stop:1599 length:609 start_codon:yes stop_codon:yes gene_type:complete
MQLVIFSGTKPNGEEFHLLVNSTTGWTFGPVFSSVEQIADFESFCFGITPESHKKFELIPSDKIVDLWGHYLEAVAQDIWPPSKEEWGTLNMSFESYANKFDFMRRWNLSANPVEEAGPPTVELPEGDVRKNVENMLDGFGKIAAELWNWDETKPVYFDNKDIYLEDAYEQAYFDVMKIVSDTLATPKPFGLAFTGNGGGEA